MNGFINPVSDVGVDQYVPIAASTTTTLSTTAAGVGTGVGAKGDYLSHVDIVPATTAAGAVTIKDGAGSAITIWAGGGTTALTSLVPFSVFLGITSVTGAWSITTLGNVSVIGVGRFT